MRIKTLKTIMAVLLITAMLLAMAPAAYSHDMQGAMCGGKWDGKGVGHRVQRVDIPVMITGTSGNSTTYTVNAVAIKGKKDMVAVVTFDNPLKGVYNASNDMGYMSTKNKDGMTIRVDTVNNSTLPVAGASAVMSVQHIRRECKTRDYTITSFDRVVMHMPDGTVKAYDLEKPVTMIKSKDRKMVITDANPAYTKALMDSLQGGSTFPTGTAPMPIQDLISSEASASSMNVGGMKPMAVAPPTAAEEPRESS
jgi:hypothetical protein